MRIQFSFRHMESSDGLMAITESKFEALRDKFGAEPLRVSVTFSLDGKTNKMHASVIMHDGYDVEAEDVGDNAYALVDVVAHKLVEQMRRHKERVQVRKLQIRGRGVAAEDAFESVSDSEFWSQPAIDADNILGLPHKGVAPLETVSGASAK